MSEIYEDLLSRLNARAHDRASGQDGEVSDLCNEALIAIKHLQGYYSDLNAEAIMISRKMLKGELGIEHAFFDDCVGHAIAIAKELGWERPTDPQ